jgi:ribosomal protein L3 glutamine methyltransferase
MMEKLPRSPGGLSKVKTLGEFVEHAAAVFEAAELAFGHGTASAFDDAAFLVLETLKLPVDELEEHWGAELTAEEKTALEDIIRARVETRKPSSYLVNRAYIQGIPFYVDERVIVPRSFIAEILCHEDGFSKIENMEINSVLDLCTGSGCLAILAAHLFDGAKIDAVDLSKDALEVAHRNVDEAEFKDRIELLQGNLFEPLKGRRYDLIITNPPYVDEATVDNFPAEHKTEPTMAFAGGKDGLDLVRVILKEAANHLTPDGGIICEIGQGKEILEAEYNLPFLWLDTEHSEGEVFWLSRKQLEK